jgi:hypothetical protein
MYAAVRVRHVWECDETATRDSRAYGDERRTVRGRPAVPLTGMQKYSISNVADNKLRCGRSVKRGSRARHTQNAHRCRGAPAQRG